MRFLHTSDWHLGRSLYGRKRYDEFNLFLDWLYNTIKAKEIDVLIVAGDVFDTTTPGNRAQELYYRFLCRTASTCCSHIIITGGNHDSPSFLDAPKEVLLALNVHVIGSAAETPDEEVFLLSDKNNVPKALVCAVPYLRDRDIRTVVPGESADDKNAKLIDGTLNHYKEVCSSAVKRQSELIAKGCGHIPIIATGHLFTAGGKTVDGDGVRELYVGTLSHINADSFPGEIDYLALGHLHVPQKVGNRDNMRYSGSPIAMGFGEAGQQKKVLVITFHEQAPEITEIDIPCFQPLKKISGTVEEITNAISKAKADESNAWLEIEYTGNEIVPNLNSLFDECIKDSKMEIRRIKNKTVITRTMNRFNCDETLDDLDPIDVFKRCLQANEIEEEQRTELLNSYMEILKTLDEEDVNRE
jgi:exonuclease SbcD